MRKALKGIDTFFLLNPVVPDELNRALLALDLAIEAGIKRIVYFSMFHADVFLDCPHASAKYATEVANRLGTKRLQLALPPNFRGFVPAYTSS